MSRGAAANDLPSHLTDRAYLAGKKAFAYAIKHGPLESAHDVQMAVSGLASLASHTIAAVDARVAADPDQLFIVQAEALRNWSDMFAEMADTVALIGRKPANPRPV